MTQCGEFMDDRSSRPPTDRRCVCGGDPGGRAASPGAVPRLVDRRRAAEGVLERLVDRTDEL